MAIPPSACWGTFKLQLRRLFTYLEGVSGAPGCPRAPRSQIWRGSQAGARRTCWFSGSSTGAQSLFKSCEMLSVDSQRGAMQPSQVSGGCQQQMRFWAIGSSLSGRLEASWAGGVCPAEGPEGPGLPCPCDCRHLFIVNTAASDPRRAVGRGKARRRRCLIGLHPSVAILPWIARERAPDAAGPPCCPFPCALSFIAASTDCAVGPRHPEGR